MTPDELTRLREEVARLTRERDAAHAKYLGAIEANEEWHQVVIKLRAAIAPTEDNVGALARVAAGDGPDYPWDEREGDDREAWLEDARLFLAAINERAKL